MMEIKNMGNFVAMKAMILQLEEEKWHIKNRAIWLSQGDQN